MEKDILKFICANQGAVNTDELLFNLSCNDSTTLSEVLGNKEKFVSVCPHGQPKVVARTRLQLCRALGCPGCRGLHLCKHYLFSGSCRFGRMRKGCTFSHDLDSCQNQKVLKEFELEMLDRTELCTLLMQNDNYLMPQICYDYNNSQCSEGDACKRLHICEKNMSVSCSCTKNHDFNAPQPLQCLKDRHVPEHLMHVLKSVYSNKGALRLSDRISSRGNRGDRGNRGKRGNARQQPLSRSTSDIFSVVNNPEPSSDERQNGRQKIVKDKTEICMYFIKGYCRHEERCFKAHDKMPYRWQIKQGDQWTAMADNEKIEKDYCDPKNTSSNTNPQVDFDTMTCGPDPVRRISTINCVREPTFIHTTEWVWYWEDEFGSWREYASPNAKQGSANITSKELEEKFLNNEKDVVEFTAGSQSYSLSFQDMIQTNKMYGTKKLVKRRPRFVSETDVQTQRVRRPQSNFAAVPDCWDKTQIPLTGYKRIPLRPTSSEYKEIENLFCQTLTGFDILKMERIQNKALWEAYQLQKNHMKNKNHGRDPTERKLFHGTEPRFVDPICADNFDWRLCGVHGTAYGQGSYFARDARYSHSYTGQSDVRSMFVSRVLVGDYTLGSREYKRAPSKDGGDLNFYDSCVDDQFDPAIFVVFDKHQIYPDYVLQYKEKRSTVSVHNLYGVSTTSTPVAAARRVVVPAPAPVTAPKPAPKPVPKPAPPSYQPSTSSFMFRPSSTRTDDPLWPSSSSPIYTAPRNKKESDSCVIV